MRAKNKLNLGILVSGNGTNLESIICACKSGGIDAAVGVVISDTPGAFALERAKKHGLANETIERKSFKSNDDFENAIAETLKKHSVELVCLAGFMRIVHAPLLMAFANRIVNIHPALLPSFPGLDAQAKAWEYGVKVAGCTVHFVDEETDHGPIIAQTPVIVMEDDTPETIREKILKEEHRLYPVVIQLIAEGRVVIEGRRVRIT